MHTIEIGSSVKVVMFILVIFVIIRQNGYRKIVKQIENVSIIVRLEDINVCVKRH